jgi:hypothetical protein
MAGLGYKSFSAGDVLTAAQVQGYLQDQAVMRFADSTARASAIGTANFTEGMISYLDNTNQVEYYSGSTWASIAPVSTQGLTLLNTTSFSAVASASLPASTFSSTYTNYRLVVNIDAASTDSQILTVRLRAAGTDATGSNYSWALVKNAYTNSGTFDGATQTSWIVGNSGVTNANFAFDLLQPFNAEPTNISGYAIQSSDIFFVAAKHTLSTSYDSLTILIGSGTMTGSYSIFGYNK